MAEKIKKELLICSQSPRVRPYACITAGKLNELLVKIRALDYKNFVDVYKYAKKLDLPEDFLKELKFEYEIRGL